MPSRGVRTTLVGLVAFVVAFLPVTAALAGAIRAAAAGPGSGADFNGDGFADLAVGSDESVNEVDGAGGVNVIYGGAGGLSAGGDQFWSQDSPGVLGTAGENEDFGNALASGDFDGDGRSDLAIGVWRDDVGVASIAGAVSVLYGSPGGLTATGDQLWTQNSPGIPGVAKQQSLFGVALAVGNFGKGPQDDLAIGSEENVGTAAFAGSVTIIFGSPSGLSSAGSQRWTQNSPNVKDRVEAGDIFGSALAAGELGKGPRDDLAIGAQQEDVGREGSEKMDAGIVHVLYGSTSGLTATGNQLWSQNSPMVPGVAESGDGFGTSLGTGNFGRGAQDDLAVGASAEDGGATNSGTVHVIYGSQGGLTTTGNQAFVQGPGSGLQGTEDQGDFFGGALAAGNFGKSTHDDLAIGVFGESVDGFVQAGAVAVVYGSATGLRPAGNQLWAQTGNPDLLDASEDFDNFGKVLAAGNYGMDPHDDLAIGVLFEDLSAIQNVGLVNVMYSDGSVLNAPGNQIWSQDSSGIEGEAEQDDGFGGTLG